MHKKTLFLIIQAAILMLSFQTIAHADEATITTDHVNVRSGPGTYYEKIGQVHSEEIYPILQYKGQWVEIQYGSKSGWLHSDYVTIQVMGDEIEETVQIVHDKTQIRNGPSTEHDIIHFANKGDKFTVVSEKGDWYEIENDSVQGFVQKKLLELPVKGDGIGLKNKTIVIDAGHGGRDAGAISVNNTFEKDLTFKTAMELAKELEILGANVMFTRENDEYISLNSRSSLANNHDIDVFISLHYNSVPELPSVTGIGTYYYHKHDKQLAASLQRGLVMETDANDRGTGYGDYQVIRTNLKPSVLIELGFISNPEKEKLLLTNGYQKKLVKGIITGLEHRFSNQ